MPRQNKYVETLKIQLTFLRMNDNESVIADVTLKVYFLEQP